ncbi:SRPBCC family protein [Fontivita pretiosa]|uniref:SRPBCC family protein n=1 Tax=Fontivita pretiosa TaxID=2989684 RepID=UPI003D17E325
MTTLSTERPTTVADLLAQPGIEHEQPDKSRQINVSNTERMWSMIGGSAVALFGLARGRLSGLALAGLGGMLLYRGFTGYCPLNAAIGRNSAESQGPAEPEQYFTHGIHVEHCVTVNRPAEELFQFWRNFENLPRFMQHLESVKCLDASRSQWVARAPAGFTVQWDAQIINEEPNTLIAWRSLGATDVDNAGSVRFVSAPGDRGTEVHVVLDYIPPAGKFGSLIASLFGKAPEQQIRQDLRRFKQLMEAGEIPTTQGQPRGACR